jgi:hypothetical protein
LEFKITQKNHSEGILYELLNYFKCGSVVIDNRKSDTKKYHISSLSEIINNIIPHFDNYPCLTSKFLNFKDFKQITLIMAEKEHLNVEGMQKIITLASKMNTARPFEEKFNYLNSEFYLDTPDYFKINNNIKNLPPE